MENLSVDIETFCEIDIKKAGGYRYAIDAEVLLFGYSVDFGEPECVDLKRGEEIPEDIVRALFDPTVKKSAHNAAFERAVLGHYFTDLIDKYHGIENPSKWQRRTWEIIRHYGGYLPADQWQCTQIMCARAGYPLDLDGASVALGVAEKKDKKGRDLIRLFSVPRKPTKARPHQCRNLPHDYPDRWEEFKEYCKQDVRTEQAIAKALSWIPVIPEEDAYWQDNERMNERGLQVEMQLVEGAIRIDEDRKKELLEEAAELTGLDNPNSRNQVLDWLNAEGDVEAEKLTKESVKDMLELTNDDTVRRVLELRQEIAKSSTRKYAAILNSVCPDGRVRGMIQFNGAPRTGRDAGRIIQPQNLPRMHMGDAEIETARKAVMLGDKDFVGLMWPNIPDLLSQLIRTALVAREGHRFLVVDLNSIESRVLAWLAGEEWKLEVFNTHGKIYEATASRMFNVPIETVTKGSEMRQRGKVAELALGYGGAVNAITTMDADKGIPDEAKPELVRMYRKANPRTVKFWYDLERAAISSIKNPGDVYKIRHGLAFCTKKNVLLMRLPSGRLLHYSQPFLTQNRWGNEAIGFWGMDQKKSGKWSKQETYGGKLAENVTQATARDVLMHSTRQMVLAGYHPVLKVHDETVCEEKMGFGSVEEMEMLMCKKADWMGDLPLKAEGFESFYYKK